MKSVFEYKGYGRIYTDPEHTQKLSDLIKEIDTFESDYIPESLVGIWDDYPNTVYIGKFELDRENFEKVCNENNIPAFVFSASEYSNGYYKLLNKAEIQSLAYTKLKNSKLPKSDWVFSEDAEVEFNSWFNDTYGKFSTRSEYFYGDVSVEDLKTREDLMYKWAHAAFVSGFEKAKSYSSKTL
jgi:hypothetical protein